MSKRPRAVSCGNNWVGESVPWIWDGLLAADAITLLSAPVKSGKTTLLSLLLDRRREGGQLLGRVVHPGRTVLCSEEPRRLWALRQPPLDFGPNLSFHQPYNDTPSRGGWRRFINHVLDLGGDAFDLLVIDTVMSFLPAGQNNHGRLLWAVNELRVVSNMPAAVLLLHQGCTARNRSRARGPLTALVDILLDLEVPPGDRFTRRRHLYGVGRYPGTLRHVAAELNAEGTDYLVLADCAVGESPAPALETLRLLLGQSATSLTRQEIRARWPAGEAPPRADSLWRCLARGCEQGIFVRTGAGTRAEAFRYGLSQGRPVT